MLMSKWILLRCFLVLLCGWKVPFHCLRSCKVESILSRNCYFSRTFTKERTSRMSFTQRWCNSTINSYGFIYICKYCWMLYWWVYVCVYWYHDISWFVTYFVFAGTDVHIYLLMFKVVRGDKPLSWSCFAMIWTIAGEENRKNLLLLVYQVLSAHEVPRLYKRMFTAQVKLKNNNESTLRGRLIG